MISILAISSNPEMAVFLGFERSFLVLRLIFRCTRVVGALFDTCWIIPFLRNKLNGNNANLETNLVSFDCWVPQNIARIFVSCFHLWLVLCDTIDRNMPPPPPSTPSAASKFWLQLHLDRGDLRQGQESSQWRMINDPPQTRRDFEQPFGGRHDLR